MQVFARTLEGETVALEVSACDEIGSLKSQIPGAVDAGLVFGGLSLDDSMTVGSCLEAGSTMHVVPLLCGGGDGTPAMGKRHKKSHGLCCRCGKRSFHNQKK
eukprot:CAMPEP_0195091444 /NCGR_PEP_ID=MMETSP0448-20130528/33540_1 /TAXON_ID=66468 /ORGANISM="Heterocapsa triquestra, Strain CCMP 448" /LENGTH=101 /DNA_ID=CAMNT_0040125281 /DNA_START=83 /DNA_END=385 /DNA_ORIENTATION=+